MKEIITKTLILNERKTHINKKEKYHIMNFLDKGKGDIKDFLE